MEVRDCSNSRSCILVKERCNLVYFFLFASLLLRSKQKQLVTLELMLKTFVCKTESDEMN